MTDKVIVYSKQPGGLPVSVTVRIEWLPDGRIKPLAYWMPDGACYGVKHIYEMTHIAHLKDRGEGIRYKVRIGITESPEPNSGYLHTQHETYLYFADNWFCGQNFIDSRYGHIGKEYIPVTLDVFPDGDYELVYFKARGIRYMVEKTIAIEPRGSFYAGGVGIWHKVEARRINDEDDEDLDPNKSIVRPAALYLEINKWFVTVKAT